ncbi:sigma-70 family RNA polymerase sigma factor [bacterium]|nr:sigma-70 family RNA polymerase sigma factor [bacterium]
MEGFADQESFAAFTDDKELISRLKQMDQEAISFVWHMYYQRLVHYALGMTQNPNAAEELVSMVFERFLEILNRGKGPKKNVKAYLYRMTYNVVIDNSRAQKHVDDLSDGIVEEKNSLEETAEQSDKIKSINRALNSLTADQRNLILLRFVEGLTMRETAEVMSKSINAIKTMQSRAVNSLKKTPEFMELAKDYD